MASTVIAGKPSNTVGDKDSTLVLRGSSVKIQWGNKFIDLIKNGKLNVDLEKILKTANSIDEVKQDGIYLIEDLVWLILNGTKIQLSGNEVTTYVSFLIDQQNEAENKQRALHNIGFYYNTLQEAQNAGLVSGIIYILEENKLYTIIDGVIAEYIPTDPKSEEDVEKELKTKLYIEEYSLFVDGEEYIRCDLNKVEILKLLVTYEGVQSKEASPDYGYRLYMLDEESFLEVDNIIERNYSEKINILQIKYHLEDNVILNISNISDNVKLTLLKSNKYQIGDILTTSVIINLDEVYVLVTVDFEILSILSENVYTAKLIVNSTDSAIQNKITSNLFLYKIIYYKQGKLPVIKIENHNYDLIDSEQINVRIGTISDLESKLLEVPIKQYLGEEVKYLGIYSNYSVLNNSNLIMPNIYISELKKYTEINTKIGNIYPELETKGLLKYYNSSKTLGIYSDNAFIKDSILLQSEIYIENNNIINTKIGTISNINIENKDISEYTNNSLGIYSNNTVLYNPKLIKPEEYNPVFKDVGTTDISEKYPRYDDTLTLPNNLLELNNAIPNVAWIKQLIDLCIPIGTIVMWNGDNVPNGWAICDGNNGTPNLIGKFIKADVKVAPNTVDNNLNEDNELSIKISDINLPEHHHPHQSHRHGYGDLSGVTGESGDLTASLVWSDYLWNLQFSKSKVNVMSPPVSGDNISSVPTTSVVSDVSVSASTLGGNTVGGNHYHSVRINNGNTEYATSLEVSGYEWANNPLKFKIEPHAYSLIFIMKIKNFASLII